ncbi:MAG: alpha/beta hydrolase [Bacteroidetes bacterium]|nr:alpha/beta hydrolase [Bacteroidota bacterium]
MKNNSVPVSLSDCTSLMIKKLSIIVVLLFLAFLFAFAKDRDALRNKSTRGKYITCNGVKIYFEIYGKGEPLLLLHGNSQSIADLKYQIPFFAEKFKVIAVDSRSHGKSDDSKQDLDYYLMASDMNQLLDSLHLDSVNVLGWSDGGNIGLILAARYGKKVKKLACMGANLYSDKSSVNEKELKWARRIRMLLNILGIFNKKARHDKKFIKLLLKCNINKDDLPAIRIPVLIMAGENDIIKEDHTKLIARSIPNAHLIIFPNSTHFIPRENPVLYNNTVLNFFLNANY